MVAFDFAKRSLLTLPPSAIPSGGFAVVPVSSLYFDVLVLWVIVMYISAYPEIIVMRNSNVSVISTIVSTPLMHLWLNWADCERF